jgi:hypothetical protein
VLISLLLQATHCASVANSGQNPGIASLGRRGDFEGGVQI